MKAASLKDLQAELENLDTEELTALCLRLARFKKENKELLTYLLFEAFDEEAYIRSVLDEIDEAFAAMNPSQLYFMKKSLRKVLRMIGTYARYTASPVAEVQMLLHYCRRLKETGIDLKASPVISNLFHNPMKKITKRVAGLHEDLQYDYIKQLDRLK